MDGKVGTVFPENISLNTISYNEKWIIFYTGWKIIRFFQPLMSVVGDAKFTLFANKIKKGSVWVDL